jgi:hypothetical protein
MDRSRLIGMMVQLLQASLEEHGSADSLTAAPDSPLVGAHAVVSSLALVGFITDVESSLAEQFQFDTILVNEKALSRKNSPFRSVEVLADYILELAEEAAREQPAAKGVVA